jgi:hypothetical protein
MTLSLNCDRWAPNSIDTLSTVWGNSLKIFVFAWRYDADTSDLATSPFEQTMRRAGADTRSWSFCDMYRWAAAIGHRAAKVAVSDGLDFSQVRLLDKGVEFIEPN